MWGCVCQGLHDTVGVRGQRAEVHFLLPSGTGAHTSGSQASVFTEPLWWPLLLFFNHPDVIFSPSLFHDQSSLCWYFIFSLWDKTCLSALLIFFSLHLGNSPLKPPLSIHPLRSSGDARVSSSLVSENICYLRSERFHPLYFPFSFIWFVPVYSSSGFVLNCFLAPKVAFTSADTFSFVSSRVHQHVFMADDFFFLWWLWLESTNAGKQSPQSRLQMFPVALCISMSNFPRSVCVLTCPLLISHFYSPLSVLLIVFRCYNHFRLPTNKWCGRRRMSWDRQKPN